MDRWLDAFIPKANEPIPGVSGWEFDQIRGAHPLIVCGGEKDHDHPKRTSFEVRALIKGSRLVDPPWPEDAWERASEASAARKGSVFDVRAVIAGGPLRCFRQALGQARTWY
jgi:2-hydroxy-6-oxonona-2,4-dienedioate hydrolase